MAARNENTLRALDRVPVFAEATGAARELLAEKGRIVSFPAGSLVVAEGARADAVFGVLRGRVRIALTHEGGARSTVALVGPGDVFGELGVLGAASRSAEVTALEEASLLRIAGPDFIASVSTCAELGLALSRLLAKRVRLFGEHFRHVTSLDAEARLVQKLLFLADRFGVAQGAEIVVDLPLTQQDLAELAELSRQRTNKILRELTRAGTLAHGRRRLVIRDPVALRRLVAR